ncbi:Tetratricopeptide-like helical [Artemisia annua]|uniref:Tetratricopeptide-like helical n=1 Tax=Artemisia annua TaxID=35608 RepID=A0A2U1M1L0_ARTAN|nr:Tetratricopeptide-like helical [Artemisia annua]
MLGYRNMKRWKSGSPEKNSDWSEFLPDSNDFEDAITAAVLGSSTDPEKMKFAEKLEKGKGVRGRSKRGSIRSNGCGVSFSGGKAEA